MIRIAFASTTGPEERPPISYKIREYFSNFLSTSGLEEKYKAKYKAGIDEIGIFFGERSMAKEPLLIGKPKRIVENDTVYYEIFIPILESDKPYKLDNLIDKLVQALSHYVSSKYVGIKSKELKNLFDSIDRDLLASIEFPASFDEQKFVDDYLQSC